MTDADFNGSDETTLAALAWAARVDDASVDWDRFTGWLEADERHRSAFDAVALLHAELADARPVLSAESTQEPANDHAPAARRWWIGVAAAAALAVVAVPVVLWRAADAPAEFASGADRTMAIALAGGGRAVLAPSSRLTIDGDQVTLTGAAWFDVPHGSNEDLVVRAGAWRIDHVGTRFEVKTVDAAGVWVAVADGRVALSRNASATVVRLGPGERALATGSRIERGAVAPATIGSWRTGQLVYDDTPLAVVAADLARYAGRPVAVDAALGATRFSGSITARPGRSPVNELAALIGARVVERSSGLTLLAAGGA